ncbi:MAG: hypothetical protein QXT68_07315 [Halobacteria archaeon]
MSAREVVERPEDRRVGFKMLGPTPEDGLELLTETFDIYLRRGKGVWTVDIFRAEVPDHGRAHLASEGFATLAAALRFIGGFTGEGRSEPGPLGSRDFLLWGW